MKILTFFWEFEERKACEKSKKYAEKVDNIPDEIRDLILEKWLTYCGSNNLNEWQEWRKCLMKR
jgi:hypothetical protein